MSHKKVVAEVDSPPRVAETARRLGIDPAWSLDISGIDPEDRKSWDLSQPGKQKKAREMLRRDALELLVACPMCGPFSTWMAINYSRTSEEKVRKALNEALDHLKFSLELCYDQHKAERLFVFEHPVGATSWGTRMMKVLLKLDGVHAVNFDFCVFGMKAPAITDGQTGPAKKRTRVMTNSGHISAALARAQCSTCSWMLASPGHARCTQMSSVMPSSWA